VLADEIADGRECQILGDSALFEIQDHLSGTPLREVREVHVWVHPSSLNSNLALDAFWSHQDAGAPAAISM
jgi:hypothetical protein